MVHKKFLKVNGKTYGPYYYESYRENGKVKKRYVKTPPKLIKSSAGSEQKAVSVWSKKNETAGNKFNFSRVKKLVLFICILLVFGLGILFYNSGITGNASLDVRSLYLSGENISGNLNLVLKSGELIPAGSKIVISENGQEKEFLLSDFLSANASGLFYASGANISGSGEGFGFSGAKTIYPEINFVFRVVNSAGVSANETLENQTEITGNESVGSGEVAENNNESITSESNASVPTEQNNPEVPAPENTNEQPVAGSEQPASSQQETIIPEQPSQSEQPASSEQQTSEQPSAPEQASVPEQSSAESSNSESSSGSESSAGITGQAISTDEFEGKASKNNPFLYNVNTDEDIEILSVDKGSLQDLKKERQDGQVVVTTNYSETENGFGQEYLGDETHKLEINLDNLNIKAKTGLLSIKLIYGESVLAEASREISVEGENLTLVNGTLTNLTEINETLTNLTEINETIVNISLQNITLRQYKAVIGKPVKWMKKVTVENNTDSKIEIPKEAENITIKTGDEVAQAEKEIEDYSKSVDETSRNNIMTGNVIAVSGGGILSRFFAWISNLRFSSANQNILSGTITGNVISETDLGNSITETSDSKIVELGGVVDLQNGTEVAVEYTTPAPEAREENITGGKRIIVSADEKYNYTDILAYTTIPNLIKDENNRSIKLYHYVWHEPVSASAGVEESNLTEEISNATEVVNQTQEAVNNTLENVTNVNETLQEINNTLVNETSVNQTQEVINNSEVVSVPEVVESNQNNIVSDNSGSGSADNLTKAEQKEADKENKQAEKDAAKKEKDTGKGKKSLLTGNVIADIEINSEGNLSAESVAGYWTKEEVDFTAYDLDEDGNIDYVEWNVAHLSNQTYEIIYITKAEHLDSNYTFIEDVYSQVSALDGNYTAIPDSHTLRVTFEQNLTNKKDITIYARAGNVSIDNQSVEYDVYAMKKRIDEIRRELENMGGNV